MTVKHKQNPPNLDEVCQIISAAISVLRRVDFIVLHPDGPYWNDAVERARQSINNGSGGMIQIGFDCMDAALRAAASQTDTDE